MIVEIPLEDVLKVLPFVAKQDVRYYLNGMFITPHNGGALLVATDGHRLAVCESPLAKTDADHILNLSGEFAKALPKLAKGVSKRLTIEDANAHIVIRSELEEHAVKPGKPFIDGKFPEWRRALPNAEELEPGLIGALDARYLEDLRLVIPEGQRAPIMFWHRKEAPAEHASVFRFGGVPEFLVAIMPIRAEYPTTWPDWMPREPKKEEAA
jgi:hypothetical protein